MASLHSSSENPMMARQPCHQTKPNHSIVCEAVRYRLLSTEGESPQHGLTLLLSPLADSISVEDLLSLAAFRGAPPAAAAVDSLSRHSPRFPK